MRWGKGGGGQRQPPAFVTLSKKGQRKARPGSFVSLAPGSRGVASANLPQLPASQHRGQQRLEHAPVLWRDLSFSDTQGPDIHDNYWLQMYLSAPGLPAPVNHTGAVKPALTSSHHLPGSSQATRLLDLSWPRGGGLPFCLDEEQLILFLFNQPFSCVPSSQRQSRRATWDCYVYLAFLYPGKA